MPMIVRRQARTDINKIAVYIGDRNLDAGLRFLDVAKNSLQQLRANPGMGGLRQMKSKRLGEVRSWPITGFENFIIFYRRLEGGEIEILRVLNGAQDVDRIIERER